MLQYRDESFRCICPSGGVGEACEHVEAFHDDDELYYSLNCLIARHTCFANRGDSLRSE